MFEIVLCVVVLLGSCTPSDIIVTNNEECTRIGRALFERSATVEQTYVAVSLCEGLVHPMDSGIGGGFQALLHNARPQQKSGSRHVYLMSREYSPMDKSFRLEPFIFGNSVGVPAVLAGYARLLGVNQCIYTTRNPLLRKTRTAVRRKSTTESSMQIDYRERQSNLNASALNKRSMSTYSFNRECVNKIQTGETGSGFSSNLRGIPYKEIFEPVIRLASKGFVVSPTLGSILNESTHLPFFIKKLPNGKATNYRLAVFMQHLSFNPLRLLDPYVKWNNRDVHSLHDIRSIMLNDVRHHGSKLTQRDFRSYRAEVRAPLTVRFSLRNIDYDLITLPSPGGGESIAFFSKMLEELLAKGAHKTLTPLQKSVMVLFLIKYTYAAKAYFRQISAQHKRRMLVIESKKIARELYKDIRMRPSESALVDYWLHAIQPIPNVFGGTEFPVIKIAMKGERTRADATAIDGDEVDRETLMDLAENDDAVYEDTEASDVESESCGKTDKCALDEAEESFDFTNEETERTAGTTVGPEKSLRKRPKPEKEEPSSSTSSTQKRSGEQEIQHRKNSSETSEVKTSDDPGSEEEPQRKRLSMTSKRVKTSEDHRPDEETQRNSSETSNRVKTSDGNSSETSKVKTPVAKRVKTSSDPGPEEDQHRRTSKRLKTSGESETSKLSDDPGEERKRITSKRPKTSSDDPGPEEDSQHKRLTFKAGESETEAESQRKRESSDTKRESSEKSSAQRRKDEVQIDPSDFENVETAVKHQPQKREEPLQDFLRTVEMRDEPHHSRHSHATTEKHVSIHSLAQANTSHVHHSTAELHVHPSRLTADQSDEETENDEKKQRKQHHYTNDEENDEKKLETENDSSTRRAQYSAETENDSSTRRTHSHHQSENEGGHHYSPQPENAASPRSAHGGDHDAPETENDPATRRAHSGHHHSPETENDSSTRRAHSHHQSENESETENESSTRRAHSHYQSGNDDNHHVHTHHSTSHLHTSNRNPTQNHTHSHPTNHPNHPTNHPTNHSHEHSYSSQIQSHSHNLANHIHSHSHSSDPADHGKRWKGDQEPDTSVVDDDSDEHGKKTHDRDHSHAHHSHREREHETHDLRPNLTLLLNEREHTSHTTNLLASNSSNPNNTTSLRLKKYVGLVYESHSVLGDHNSSSLNKAVLDAFRIADQRKGMLDDLRHSGSALRVVRAPPAQDALSDSVSETVKPSVKIRNIRHRAKYAGKLDESYEDLTLALRDIDRVEQQHNPNQFANQPRDTEFDLDDLESRRRESKRDRKVVQLCGSTQCFVRDLEFDLDDLDLARRGRQTSDTGDTTNDDTARRERRTSDTGNDTTDVRADNTRRERRAATSDRDTRWRADKQTRKRLRSVYDATQGYTETPWGTTNVVIKTGNRSIVATSSINHSFGSLIFSQHLGIPYNNVLRDFTPYTWYQVDRTHPRRKRKAKSLGKGIVFRNSNTKNTTEEKNLSSRIKLFANRPLPHSIPQSNMGCTILSNRVTRNPVFGIGAAGGFKITSAIINTMWNYFFLGDNLEEAVSKLRITTKLNYKTRTTEIWYEFPSQSSYQKDLTERYGLVYTGPSYKELMFAPENMTSANDTQMMGRVAHSPQFFYKYRDDLQVKYIAEAGYSAATAFTTMRDLKPRGSSDPRRGGSTYVKL